jgi:hypothetical protein
MWTEEELVWTLAVVMIANALVTFVVLILGVHAPYGRYFSEMNLGFLINGNLAWFIQVRQLWSVMSCTRQFDWWVLRRNCPVSPSLWACLRLDTRRRMSQSHRMYSSACTSSTTSTGKSVQVY